MVRRTFLSVLALAGLAACDDLTLEGDRVPTRLQVQPEQFLVVQGETLTPQVTVLDQHGRPMEAVPSWARPVWTSSDDGRIAVDGTSLRAVGPGQATATVSLASLTAEAVVRVNPHEMVTEIAAVYLNQGIQRLNGSIPLVADRAAYLRVFLRSDRPNFFGTKVRVTLYQGGAPVQTLNLTQAAAFIPEAVDEGQLVQSWNAVIPAGTMRPGLSLSVEVDPDGSLPLAAGSRVRHPEAGTLPLDVRTTPHFRLRMVPVIGQEGLVPGLNAGTVDDYVSDLIAMHPIGSYEVELRPPYHTMASAATSAGWSDILREIRALRVAEGSTHYYYGMLRPPLGSGIAGLGYVGFPVSVGYDAMPEGAGTLAHELGHNFGRWHSPCGNPSGVDAAYPHADATLGAYGMHVSAGAVVAPSAARDLMSYCRPRWISDYTYEAVLNFRLHQEAERVILREPALLVWGGVRGGRLVLEPSFELDMPAEQPRETGPYRVEGYDAAGARLFSYAFQGEAVDHLPGERHFAFAIPAHVARTDRLATIRLVGPEGVVERSRGAAPAGPGPVRLQRSGVRGPGVRASWNAAEHPMALVRDARTGRILSFARGGEAVLPDDAREVEVLLSDGVRTTRSVHRVQ
jgi:hypothetical protein